MSGRISKNRRTKSSKIICEERYCCDGENEEALFECEECHTKQCQSCEAKLHEIPKYEAHDRKRIQPAPAEKLCQLSCKDKNFADVRCTNCELNFCHDCFDKMHAHGRRKNHEKTSVNSPSKSKQTTNPSSVTGPVNSPETISKIAPLPVDRIEGIKPLSPIEDDDSLTYLSMPQDQEQEDSITVLSESGPQITPTSSLILNDCFAMKSHSNSSPLGPTAALDGDMQPMFDPDDMDIMGHLSLDDDIVGQNISDDEIYGDCKSFLVADQNEQIQVFSLC